MIKCVNKDCKNFGHELDDHAEICPACGKSTEKTKALPLANLGIVAVLASLVSIVLLYSPIYYLSFVISPACIVVSFIVKSVPAIIITFLALIAIVAIFVVTFAL